MHLVWYAFSSTLIILALSHTQAIKICSILRVCFADKASILRFCILNQKLATESVSKDNILSFAS